MSHVYFFPFCGLFRLLELADVDYPVSLEMSGTSRDHDVERMSEQPGWVSVRVC